MSKIRVGIIGCGGIANGKHMPSLQKQACRVEMVAFCDLIEERAQSAASQYGSADARIYTDYRALLEDKSIDAVHVCTPNVSHCEISVAAMEAGKHVLCEKPMAATAADAKKMLDTHYETGKLLAIGHQYRMRNDSLGMKQACVSGELGDIYFAQAHALRRRGIPTWGVFTSKEANGGGPLLDLGTHALDLALWMMDNYKPKTVRGVTFDKLGTTLTGAAQGNLFGPWNPEEYGVEDAAFGLITMENGATIVLQASWALNILEEKAGCATVCGTLGGATVQPSRAPGGNLLVVNKVVDGHLTTREVEFANFNRPEYSFSPFWKADASERECIIWLDAISGKRELIVKPEQAYTVTRILDAIYESARMDTLVRFDSDTAER